VKDFIKKITGIHQYLQYKREDADKTKILIAQGLINQIKKISTPVSFDNVEFSAFSQWGDDGIIQYLLHILNIDKHTFIEFGVGNYTESNTRFLLMNNNWKGLIFDGSEKNIDFVKNDSISWKFDLTAQRLFVTKHNINHAISAAGFEGEIGILHIDIDGNDYWIWEALNSVNPQIVIMEYNSAFGVNNPITTLYDDGFFVTNAHYSNLFFGASLSAMCFLANKKGYSFIGSNTNGNNAYFVRNDKMGILKKISAKEGYVKSRFRQNRDKNGAFTFMPDTDMIVQCGHLPVLNVETNETAPLSKYL
jgi:hypothetical protein